MRSTIADLARIQNIWYCGSQEGVGMGKRVVIIGAGAGGASVAAEAKRTDPSLAISMIEQRSEVSVAA
jgi:hypothetical protein